MKVENNLDRQLEVNLFDVLNSIICSYTYGYATHTFFEICAEYIEDLTLDEIDSCISYSIDDMYTEEDYDNWKSILVQFKKDYIDHEN